MYVLGIDGGGTKTKGVISNSKGEILAEATVGATNPNSVAKPDLELELAKLIETLYLHNRELFPQIKRVFAGMSGVDHITARKGMEQVISKVLPNSIPVTVHNDAITALYSGTFGKPGIVQIGGTGSITFGLNKDGNLERVGGWGYLLGEKGSGYALGSQGLEAAFSAYDGLGSRTELTRLFQDHFNVEKLPDIIHSIYQAKNQKERIASLSKLVVEAADTGDSVSQKIIENNASYIGKAIVCLINRLFSSMEEVVPVVLTGGLFNRLDLFQGGMEQEFQLHGRKVKLIKPKIEPVGGAVVAALLEENMAINEEFMRSK
ncbi:N-acetylglucosamine kinase [Ornithinibacillus salinisoli]|uniref:N-acetylglucosamine kinase n=1 Tax=Ornithinibacillus salinisoli TaxID=1848459 RepID=A0ABW4VZ90_9BACI